MGPPHKLHLGCGITHVPGWINCDVIPSQNVDVCFDVCHPWPFADNSASEIYASHVLEHLDAIRPFFAEAHRVLVPNGSIQLRMPYGFSTAAWADIEHKRPFFPESFCWLQPGYFEATHNPQHRDNKVLFGVGCGLKPATALLKRWYRWPFRRLFLSCALRWHDMIDELWVTLYALKGREAIESYRASHDPCVMPTSFVAWQHELRGQELPVGAEIHLVPFGLLR